MPTPRDHPLVVAHRGASAKAPENTLAAFSAAAAAGADMVEMDVRLTADGIPVILHDADLAVTTDGAGWVHEVSLGELKGLDASPGTRSRAEVPTLAEALEALAAAGLGADLEIKNLPGDPGFEGPEEHTLRAALAAIDAAAFAGRVIVSSFNWLTLERCRELRPELATGMLTVGAIDPRAPLDYARDAGHAWILPQAPALLEAGERFVGEAHGEGVRVGAWTVDDEDVASRLFEWGIDAVVTNDPAVGVRARASVQQ